jgi:bilin biosynthesis protein
LIFFIANLIIAITFLSFSILRRSLSGFIASLILSWINEAINPLRDLLKIEKDKNVIAIIKLAIKKINN